MSAIFLRGWHGYGSKIADVPVRFLGTQRYTHMKKSTKKASEKPLTSEYNFIVKDFSSLPEWTGKGDAFVKFSLYNYQPTIAKPYTIFKG